MKRRTEGATGGVAAAPSGDVAPGTARRNRARGRARRAAGRRAGAALVPLAIIASGGMVYQASNAAFSHTTSTPANNWTAGTVALSDNDSGVALWTVTGLKPGDSGTRCIKVTYTGSLAADVKLYVSALAATPGGKSGLAPYLALRITEGTGDLANCSDFANLNVPSVITNAGYPTTGSTLATWRASHNAWASGAGTWTGVATNGTRTYQIEYTLMDDNNAQDAGVNASFIWEARNT